MTRFCAGGLICPSCQLAAVLRRCSDGQITPTASRVSCPKEGRFAVVTNVGRGMRWTAWCDRRSRARRTAKSCGPDISTLMSSWRQCLRIAAATVTKKPDHRGEHEVTGTTIAQGMPECFGEPVVTNSYDFYLCIRGCGCVEHPAFPAPSVFGGTIFARTRRQRSRGNVEARHCVVARPSRRIARRCSSG